MRFDSIKTSFIKRRTWIALGTCFLVLILAGRLINWLDMRSQKEEIEIRKAMWLLDREKYDMQDVSHLLIPEVENIEIALVPKFSTLFTKEVGVYYQPDERKEIFRVKYQNNPLNRFYVSPDGSRIGFSYRESTNSQKHNIAVMKRYSKEIQKIYDGHLFGFSWEWADNNHITVNQSCGTYCMYAYTINVDTGKTVKEGHVYDEEYTRKNLPELLPIYYPESSEP